MLSEKTLEKETVCNAILSSPRNGNELTQTSINAVGYMLNKVLNKRELVRDISSFLKLRKEMLKILPNLEPTYLRYVYDGLNKGSLNTENAAALPHGLIGLYEQEFAQKTPVTDRKNVLNHLGLWALFKGCYSKTSCSSFGNR